MSAAPSTTASAALPRWRVFPPIALGVIMATLDASIVSIATPTLQQQFGVALTTVEWVILGYSIPLTGLLLTAGRLADLRGRRGIYATGLGVFTIASLLCGLAPTIGMLIAARMLQGVGAALVSANGSALLVSAFPLEERGKALGAFGAMVGVGLAIGAPLGGVIVHHFSWRWIFLMNLPLGVIAWFLLRARVPADVPNPNAPALDARAAALWCGALVSLMFALSRGPVLGWSQPLVLGAFGAGAALLLAFSAAESRAKAPMLPLPLVLGPLGAAVLLTMLAQGMTVALGFHLPLYLMRVRGLDAQAAGVWSMALPVAALFFAPTAGRLADKVGARVLTTLGMAMTAAGFFALAGLGVQADRWRMLLGLAAVGAGQGLFTVPNASALLSLVPREQLGIASGLQNTTRYLGLSAGAAFMGAMLASRYAAHAGRALESATGAVDRAAFATATHDAYLVLAGVAIACTILALTQHRPGPVARA